MALQIQAVVGKITDMCWDKCVSSKPGNGLNSNFNHDNTRYQSLPFLVFSYASFFCCVIFFCLIRIYESLHTIQKNGHTGAQMTDTEKNCVANCTERFLDTSMFVANRIQQKHSAKH